MEYEVKRISTAGIAEAVAKAELYRSLNEPEEAESICRDILTIEPQHQLALRLLGLALTDQFSRTRLRSLLRNRKTSSSISVIPTSASTTRGLLYERRAKAMLKAGQPPRSLLAFFDQALRSFAEAEKVRPAGNDDAILRWNRCVRLLQNADYEWNGLEEELVSFDAQDAPPR